MSIRLDEIARHCGARLHGDAAAPALEIDTVATIGGARPGSLSFIANPRYRAQLADTRASAVFVPAELAEACPVAALVHESPYLGFALAAQRLHPRPDVVAGIADSAVVSSSATIAASAAVGAGAVVGDGAQVGARALVGPGSVVGAGARIGADARLLARVTLLDDCEVGERTIIHAGVVIGADGFGLARHADGRWEKIPQIGRVVIGADVEVGANTCIDRGALEDTRIDDGVKLDNLIQVGHGVHIGAHTAVAACVAIAGSARIGARCVIQGACSIAGHLSIADDVQLTATSAVPSSIDEAGTYSSGMPVQPNARWRRNAIRMTQLDDMAKRLKALERELGKPREG